MAIPTHFQNIITGGPYFHGYKKSDGSFTDVELNHVDLPPGLSVSTYTGGYRKHCVSTIKLSGFDNVSTLSTTPDVMIWNCVRKTGSEEISINRNGWFFKDSVGKVWFLWLENTTIYCHEVENVISLPDSTVTKYTLGSIPSENDYDMYYPEPNEAAYHAGQIFTYSRWINASIDGTKAAVNVYSKNLSRGSNSEYGPNRFTEIFVVDGAGAHPSINVNQTERAVIIDEYLDIKTPEPVYGIQYGYSKFVLDYSKSFVWDYNDAGELKKIKLRTYFYNEITNIYSEEFPPPSTINQAGKKVPSINVENRLEEIKINNDVTGIRWFFNHSWNTNVSGDFPVDTYTINEGVPYADVYYIVSEPVSIHLPIVVGGDTLVFVHEDILSSCLASNPRYNTNLGILLLDKPVRIYGIANVDGYKWYGWSHSPILGGDEGGEIVGWSDETPLIQLDGLEKLCVLDGCNIDSSIVARF